MTEAADQAELETGRVSFTDLAARQMQALAITTGASLWGSPEPAGTSLTFGIDMVVSCE